MKLKMDKLVKHLLSIHPMAWLIGALATALVEWSVGSVIAYSIGLSNGVPPVFGLSLIFGKPAQIPSVIVYVVVVYLIPMYVVARLLSGVADKVMSRLPQLASIIAYLVVLYAVIEIWGSLDDYRLMVLKLIGIGIILTVSLNLVNGWMGEFSVAHAGFMAIGAYISSIVMVWGFVNDDVFGPAVLPTSWAPYAFPFALIIGGIAAAIGALVVAIPSFRTRGDYLGIITLAFVFIVQGVINNLNFIGGARGFMHMPPLSSLTWVFIWTLLALFTIQRYVSSTLGKATSAVRDNESAAEVMTVDTRKVKMVAFLTNAFWAGIAGGLYAHMMGYINPGNFGIVMSVEVLAMLYLGGLNSITGSVVGAVFYRLLSEILRPLGLYKWVLIPVLLILIMIYRPFGLLGFQEVKLPTFGRKKEVAHAADTD